MVITMKNEIVEALDNLVMVKTSEKYVLTELTITIKELAESNKISTDKIKTLMAKILRLTENGRYQKKQGIQ